MPKKPIYLFLYFYAALKIGQDIQYAYYNCIYVQDFLDVQYEQHKLLHILYLQLIFNV